MMDLPSRRLFSESLRKREQSMGVSVKLTSIDMRMEMAVVMRRRRRIADAAGHEGDGRNIKRVKKWWP